jgi:hypothetical protein
MFALMHEIRYFCTFGISVSYYFLHKCSYTRRVNKLNEISKIVRNNTFVLSTVTMEIRVQSLLDYLFLQTILKYRK